MIGAWDYYPDVTEQEADEESFDLHYGDEINGNAEPVEDEPLPSPVLTNAPGQLRLNLGAAY